MPATFCAGRGRDAESRTFVQAVGDHSGCDQPLRKLWSRSGGVLSKHRRLDLRTFLTHHSYIGLTSGGRVEPMPSYSEPLARLLDECARRLDESEAAMADARRALDEARELARSSVLDGGSPGRLRQVFNEQRGELIASVLAALNSDTASSTEALTRLAYDPVEHEFRLGRRKLDLTDSETVVLKLLWTKAPAPVSREQMLAHLYHDGERPADRIVDVFLSNLRRKLSLVSAGRNFIQSHRGRGWTLVLQECDTTTEAEEVPRARREHG